jgi:hypothetical protein
MPEGCQYDFLLAFCFAIYHLYYCIEIIENDYKISTSSPMSSQCSNPISAALSAGKV